METEFKISSLTLFTSLVGSLFLFAAFQKIIGDSIIVVLFQNNVNGITDPITIIWVFVISWVSATVLMYSILPKLFKNVLHKKALRIAVVESSILVPLITFLFSPSLVFGSIEFAFAVDYKDILRNVLMGTTSLVVMKKFTREQHI